MNPLEIYVKRESIENEFSTFLNNKKKIIWSIYGVGGIGKSTLLNRFYEQEIETSSCFFDFANSNINEITGLEILLYVLRINRCDKFQKIQKIIENKHRSLSNQIDKVTNVAGAVPIKDITSLIETLYSDAEYTKELGLVWKTIVDTLKVGSMVFNRDKKNELISNNPELHLVLALLADIEKDKKGIIFIDTYEKIKDITVSTTLRLKGKELSSSNEVYKLSFEEYLTLILNFLYTNNEETDIKTIIAGRDRINKLDKIGLRLIKQSKVNKFEPEQIQEYLEQKDFNLPDENIIDDIQSITKGNPLILNYLTEFILSKFDDEDEWHWENWDELLKVFKNSDDEYGLIYYLTDRIATHITGWENTLWKLTIPKELNDEIAEILYPKKVDSDIYGKKYFKLLKEKGILRKGKGLDEKYYLLDEVKASLEAYIKKEFGKFGNKWYDNEQVIQLHKQLENYYSKLAEWDKYPKELTMDLLKGKSEIMNKRPLFLASYHAFAGKQNFEEEFAYLEKNRFEYWQMFIQSFSATFALTYWVADNMGHLSEFQLKNVISIFTNETKENEKKYSKEFLNYLKELKVKNKLLDNWLENEYFLINSLEKFPYEASLLGNYALFLHKQNNEQAEQYYKRAIEESPNDADNLGNYAVFLKNIKQDYKQAEQYYKRAIEANPKYANALGNYALFLENIKQDNKQAEQYYKRAIEANPKYANALGNYALFLENIKQDNKQQTR